MDRQVLYRRIQEISGLKNPSLVHLEIFVTGCRLLVKYFKKWNNTFLSFSFYLVEGLSLEFESGDIFHSAGS